MIIDPPSDFAPKRDWETFLREMEALHETDPRNNLVRQYVETAKAKIAELSA